MAIERKKLKPVFRIVTKDENGKDQYVCVAIPHKTGGGMSFTIEGRRYSAFPVKTKTDEGEESA
jgi:hypothetical protein